MSILLHGDCLEEMKGLDDDSIDLIFCDLPYGQTSCSWDCCIDLQQFWIQVMRIKKLHTPIFMTTTTKFGVSLINSAPKKCHFRYDIVWVKSASAGFLSAKKMPMRKHEMIYVFYEKLPFYDLSSHKHKFIKEMNNRKGKVYNSQETESKDYKNKSVVGKYEPPLPNSIVKEDNTNGTIDGNKVYEGKKVLYRNKSGLYDPPLPNSIVKEEKDKEYETCYGNVNIEDIKERKNGESRYDPPLPNSIVKEELCKYDVNKNTYGGGAEGRIKIPKDKKYHEVKYDPPLPNSVVKEETGGATGEDVYNATERFKNGKLTKHARNLQKGDAPIYDPPLPNSIVKEDTKNSNKNSELYGELKDNGYYQLRKKGETTAYDPALPVSVLKEDIRKDKHETAYGENIHHHNNQQKNGESIYDPPLPNSMLEVKSTRGKHSTEKPVQLMEWVLKYYSKEGDVILDPTMGSGSTGVACRNMNRNFIGIEMDAEIYEGAVNRIED